LKVSVRRALAVYDTVEIATTLPFKWSPALRMVPVGIPALLGAKEDTAYDWSLTTVPGGSAAAMSDADTRTHSADAAGLYVRPRQSERLDRRTLDRRDHRPNAEGLRWRPTAPAATPRAASHPTSSRRGWRLVTPRSSPPT
jgi:hypothetical protein